MMDGPGRGRGYYHIGSPGPLAIPPACLHSGKQETRILELDELASAMFVFPLWLAACNYGPPSTHSCVRLLRSC